MQTKPILQIIDVRFPEAISGNFLAHPCCTSNLLDLLAAAAAAAYFINFE